MTDKRRLNKKLRKKASSYTPELRKQMAEDILMENIKILLAMDHFPDQVFPKAPLVRATVELLNVQFREWRDSAQRDIDANKSE